jgi:hypothetical protein
VSVIETASLATANTFSIYAPKPIALIPPPNTPPLADAGPNLTLDSSGRSAAYVCGHTADADGDAVLFRWIQGALALSAWQPAGAGGEACLSLASVGSLQNGTHTLTLEATDGTATASDSMTLTLENSEPVVSPSGAGVYEIDSTVVLGGELSDYDGDLISYSWSEGSVVLFSGQLSAPAGGAPVRIPETRISSLSLGDHVFLLTVSDGINPPVLKTVLASVVDRTVPVLAPVASPKILWPPNHKMVDIVINANASDNSGSLLLSANILSSEAENGLGDGDMYPDWTEPAIDQATGRILFQLRAERSALAQGRTYTIKVAATDGTGNASFVDVAIVVPHDMRIK